MSEVLKFVTPDGGLRKKNNQIFAFFAKNNSILRPFKVKFLFERPVLSSAKRAQNKHNKTGEHKLNYQTFFLMTLCVKSRKEVKTFELLVTLFAIFRAANTRLL